MITVKLTDVCRPKQWKTIPTEQLLTEGYPVYGANGVIGYYSEYNHEESVVTITCRGATCGSVTLACPKAYITGNAMCLDEVKANIRIDYLYYCMKHYDFRNVISGSAQPQITRQDLGKVRIQVYSMDKQYEIVTALKRAEGIINLCKQQLSALDTLVKARFVEMFGNPVSNPMRWEKAQLQEYLLNIENGKSIVCSNEPRQGAWPAILKLSAATYGEYRPSENKALLEITQYIEGVEVHNGDLLFTRKNTPELVGMAAYVNSTPAKLMMPDLIFRLNTKERCSKVFLWQLINHKLFRAKIQNLASGSAKSMSNISKERLLKLEVYMPPIELQHDFAAFVSQVDKSKLIDARKSFSGGVAA